MRRGFKGLWLSVAMVGCASELSTPASDGDRAAQQRQAITGATDTFDSQPYVRAPVAASPVEALRQKARAQGDRVRVIVGLATDWTPEGRLTTAARDAQRTTLRAAQLALEGRLAGAGRQVSVRRRYDVLPYAALQVNEAALDALAADPAVRSVREDTVAAPALDESIAAVSAREIDRTDQGGFDGEGVTVAILDTGVDRFHPMLANKVVAEACFADDSGGGWSEGGDCPNHSYEETGSGSAVPCGDVSDRSGCDHGTHVASIATGDEVVATVGGSQVRLRGVAPKANIIAVNVFHLDDDNCTATDGPRCSRTFESDQLKGLEFVYGLRASHTIAAVNMSLGGGGYAQSCDADFPQMADAVELLRSVGIATVIAAGNSSFQGSVAKPGCISTAITVGNVDTEGVVAGTSNWSPQLDLAAPGQAILAATWNGGMSSVGSMNGTSMAAPHVAGAFALLRQALPAGPGAVNGTVAAGAKVSDLRALLRAQGEPLTDRRPAAFPAPFNETPNAHFTVPMLSVSEVLTQLTHARSFLEAFAQRDGFVTPKWGRASSPELITVAKDDGDQDYLYALRIPSAQGRQGVHHVTQIDAAGQGCGVALKPSLRLYESWGYEQRLYSRCEPSSSKHVQVWLRPLGEWRDGFGQRLTGASLWADVDDTAALFGASLRVSRSWNTTGQANAVAKLGVGDYEVSLPGLGGSGELVHVTPFLAADSEGVASQVACHVGTRVSVGLLLKVKVNCFVPATGQAMDSGFTLSALRLGGQLPPGVNAALDANQPTAATVYTPASSRNLTGKANSVQRTAVGKYTVRLAGLDAVGVGAPIVTAYGSPSTGRCWLSAPPSADGDDQVVSVACSADTRFALTWFGAAFSNANDDIASATPLEGTVGSLSGDNWGATPEAGEPNHLGYPTGPSVWFTWVAPESGTVRFHTKGSSFDTLLRLYDGDFSQGPVSSLGGSDDYGGTQQSQLTATVVAGKKYWLVLTSPGKPGKPWMGPFTLTWANNPPANDLASAPTSLSGFFGTESVNNTRALGEPGENNHAGQPAESTRWYRFTMPWIDGTLTLSTAGSSLDTVLAVYVDNGAGLVPVASSNDANGTTQSFLHVSTQGSTSYYIALGGKDGARGVIPLQWSFSAPANDRFTTATALEPFSSDLTVTGDNTKATSEPGEPSHAGASARTSLWWKWTAPSDGQVSFDTAGSTADTVIAVYTGVTVANLTLVAANADFGRAAWAKVTFTAQAGVTYRIAVSSELSLGYAGAPLSGPVVLHRLWGF